ncbi:JHE-like carboxylesterase 2 [Penaeus vannamei]|uniref:JHE-like carboxylesterase 2 n=1 Tax=Penaeus vannamei TaxID=6689 RepID=A0A3R7QDM4_PENVA|nr:JHE-like carboxylesterase 2 [Penaeus vannamei]
MYTDRMFSTCHMDAVQHHMRDEASGNRVFAYELQHRGEHSFFDDIYPLGNVSKDWVCHGDDIQYLFYKETDNKDLTRSEDRFVSRIMVDLWTNFASAGHPTPDLSLGFIWAPMTSAVSPTWHHTCALHGGLPEPRGTRILEEHANEDEQVALQGPLHPEPCVLDHNTDI